MSRLDRGNDELRHVTINRDYTIHAEGSVLVSFGKTKVLCTASIEDRVPLFLKGKGKGWLTAEYGMLPRSTNARMMREAVRGRQSGRTQEIQRLIGRSLRSIIDLDRLGEKTIQIDCDVLQADGGTRTAAITGSFVALHDSIKNLRGVKEDSSNIIKDFVAGVSVGIVGGEIMLDLDYSEDSECDTDMNVVMTGSGGIVEIQGTAEGDTFTKDQLSKMLAFAESGIASLIGVQGSALEK